jgi:predicted nuclease of restriction endonuclease-like (RecB) superfamily
MKKNHKTEKQNVSDYKTLVSGLAALLESARQTAARAVNAVLTTVYWEIGRRIVEFEQKGIARAEYGEVLLPRLSRELTRRFGRGFSVDNLETMRLFYIAYASVAISETPSRKSRGLTRRKSETSSRILAIDHLTDRFPLSWSHYVLLVRKTADEGARAFYETEALRGGWSVRQLDRQMASQFYERTLLSKNKRSLLLKGRAADHVTPEEEIKDPYVLEFLGLKDEYSESDLEEALIQRLEHFLLELGDDFTFVGRQKRLRIGREWYRIDLVFFHRKLKCLVVIDLKVGKFTHADAGQMHLYLNYAREHWTYKGENPPVGLILCAEKDAAVSGGSE